MGVEFVCPFCQKKLKDYSKIPNHVIKCFKSKIGFDRGLKDVVNDFLSLPGVNKMLFLSRLKDAAEHVLEARRMLWICEFVNAGLCYRNCKTCNLQGCKVYAALKALLYVVDFMMFRIVNELNGSIEYEIE